MHCRKSLWLIVRWNRCNGTATIWSFSNFTGTVLDTCQSFYVHWLRKSKASLKSEGKVYLKGGMMRWYLTKCNDWDKSFSVIGSMSAMSCIWCMKLSPHLKSHYYHLQISRSLTFCEANPIGNFFEAGNQHNTVRIMWNRRVNLRPRLEFIFLDEELVRWFL